MLIKGDEINNYTLEKYLGKGSYGEVWLAKKKIELSDDGILVALKFLSYQPQKGKEKEDFIRQVKREVGTWIRASGHKNIVSVQDGFAFRDDTFVIVSDFAEGGSLGDWLEANGGKSPNAEKTIEIMSEILDGLEYLHSQKPDKIIHRDLKPDNILFKSGVPCITDFGVSRMSQTITKSMAQVAATSAGTPLYMSPESFNNQPASRSMDIWSAGVILYQMLSGSYPYYADNAISLALEVISGNPPKPLSPEIPHGFQAVVAKALAKDISNRFQTAEEMKTALKNWRNVPITDTIDDEDFDKTDILQIEAEKERQREEEKAKLEREKHRREAEAKAEQERLERERLEKLQQDKEAQEKAEQERLRIEREKQARLERQRLERERAEQERLRHQKELEEANRRKQAEEARRKSEEKSKKQRNLFLGAGGGLVGIILLFVWLNLSPNNSISNVNSANNAVNKPANAAVTNKNTSANKASSSSSNTIKNSIGMEFVKIPSGSFMMGSPMSEKDRSDDETQHRVTISKDFYMGKYEVTQAQWQAVMGNNPSKFKGDNLPVENVSWEDTQEFIKKLNAKGEGTYRLPTEAEWEYAARGGKEGDIFGIGDGKNLSSEQANFDGNYPYGNGAKGKYLERTVNVGSYQANAFGLYDMHGNVWEWCADWYGAYPSGNVTDPTGATSGSIRVERGGSWYFGGGNLRSAFRYGGTPSYRYYDLGFRLIRD